MCRPCTVIADWAPTDREPTMRRSIHQFKCEERVATNVRAILYVHVRNFRNGTVVQPTHKTAALLALRLSILVYLETSAHKVFIQRERDASASNWLSAVRENRVSGAG